VTRLTEDQECSNQLGQEVVALSEQFDKRKIISHERGDTDQYVLGK